MAMPGQANHITDNASVLQALVNSCYIRLNAPVRRWVDSQLNYAFEQSTSESRLSHPRGACQADKALSMAASKDFSSVSPINSWICFPSRLKRNKAGSAPLHFESIALIKSSSLLACLT